MDNVHWTRRIGSRFALCEFRAYSTVTMQRYITSIDETITDVIVYRVHNEYTDRSRRNRAIRSYLSASRDIDAKLVHVGLDAVATFQQYIINVHRILLTLLFTLWNIIPCILCYIDLYNLKLMSRIWKLNDILYS